MDWILVVFISLVSIVIVKPLGVYIRAVLDPQAKTIFDPLFKPVENLIYRTCKVDPHQEQNWTQYLYALLGFSLVSLVVSFFLLAIQFFLPWNPQKLHAPSWHTNFNTIVSFVTNTNWESYYGANTLSYFSQTVVLGVQNFVSPAVGLGAAAAIVRGLARKSASTLGNFWVDLVRVTFYLLLPFSFVFSLFFVSQGVPQNFKPYVTVETLEGRQQTIPQGPIASRESIKMIGSNGGGFFHQSSAHPYENPTALTNVLQILLMLAIPVAQFYYFGCEVQDRRHAWYLLMALSLVFWGGTFSAIHFEHTPNPAWTAQHWTGSNWEGKEWRFGIGGAAVYMCVTTSISCGSTNSSHDSFTPLGGMVGMVNMKLSSVIYGGVGAGLYTAVFMAILCIFVSGLMVGRTPEYLGNKISAFDVKMVVLSVLIYTAVIYVGTALSCCSEWGLKALNNNGPHGFSEILYAYTSCVANNGSAFNGLSTDTPGYNVMLGLAMLIGRYPLIVLALALAGALAKKKMHEKTAGSFPVDTVLFSVLFIGVIVIIGALAFVPALIFGPVAEQLFMLKGVFFP